MTLACTLVFFRMATQWPQLMATWIQMEHPFLAAPYLADGSRSLRSKIRVTAGCMFAVTVGEYVLESIQKGLSFMRNFEHCGWTLEEQVERYFVFANRYIFERIPYSLPAAVLKTVCLVFALTGFDVRRIPFHVFFLNSSTISSII